MAASARDLDLRQHHGVETPEHVEVRFELAGVGSRMAAGLLDLLFLFLGLMVLWVGGGVIVGGVFGPSTTHSPPLSDVKMTMVRSRSFRSSSFLRMRPTLSSRLSIMAA